MHSGGATRRARQPGKGPTARGDHAVLRRSVRERRPALSKTFTVRPIRRASWYRDRAAMHRLNTVTEHRAVDLLEELAVDRDLVVRADAEHVPVVGHVVDLAEREAVRGDRRPTRFAVRDDVRRVEKRSVPQRADRTLGFVSEEHSGPERRLMEPLARESECVLTLRLRDLAQVSHVPERLFERDHE